MPNTYILAARTELDIEKTFECGQCFRWNADSNGVYRGIACGHPARVWNEGEHVYISTDAPLEFWRDYFDMERDYAAASRAFDGGEYLAACVEAGMGIRILRQEPWEALCSFIISQCNNISRIKGIVERLCALLGEDEVAQGVCALKDMETGEQKLLKADEAASAIRAKIDAKNAAPLIKEES